MSPDIDGLLDVVRRHEADFPYGWDWTALAAVGPQAGSIGQLVGSPLDDLDVGAPSELRLDAQQRGGVRVPPEREAARRRSW